MGLKFDIVVGNPPYQDASEKSHSNSLWVKFIDVSHLHLKEAGFMALVVPATWAGGDINRKVRGRKATVTSLRATVFKDGEFLYIGLGDVVSKFFPKVGVEFSVFSWQQGRTGDTTIVTSAGTMITPSSSLPWIPVNGSNVCLSLLKKVMWSDHEKLQVLQHNAANGDVRNPNIGHGEFELYNTSAQFKNSKRVFSTIDCPHRLKTKVIFSDSGYASPFFDAGVLGLCHHGRAFEVQSKQEADNLISFLNSKLVKFVTNTKAASGLAVGFTLIVNSLPKLDYTVARSDADLYSYFNLTEEEIALVEA